MTLEKLNSCYWWQEAPPRSAPTADWSDKTDIAIIGCGFTGLSAAITLARAGREVVIFEKGLIGEGASTRNGGITSGNIRLSQKQLVKRFGPERAQTFTDESVAARADLERFIEENRINCDYQAVGRIVGLIGSFASETIERDHNKFADRYGIEPRLISKAEMAEYTISKKYEAGIYRPDIGGIHPAKLLHEMARLAVDAGVKIFSETPVTKIANRKTTFTLTTTKGQVTAQHLISATNAYTDQVQPWLRRRLIP